MPVEVLLEMQRRLPNVRLWNFYGQTEIAPLATVLKPKTSCARPAPQASRCSTSRRASSTIACRTCVRARSARSCTVRHNCSRGYFHDAEKTAAAFEGGWFHSGDLATVDDEGYITVVDRKKDMIKSGGENVASREVEEMIYRLRGKSQRWQ